MPGRSASYNRRVANADQGWDVRFYLRRLNSDYVSEVGSNYIKALFNGRSGISGMDFLIYRDSA